MEFVHMHKSGGRVIIYIVRSVFNKAGDAIQNKLAEKKNKKSNGKEENLADRYK
jgi:hypothetical protein